MVKRRDAKVPINCFPLKDLFLNGTSDFFRYNGSLTTPGCQEIVVWTVFKVEEILSIKKNYFKNSLLESYSHQRKADEVLPRYQHGRGNPTETIAGQL